MWIVRLALRRPYTFTVMAIVILLLGVGSAWRMPKDIFPSVDIPVVNVVWTYGGLAPSEMEGQITTFSEYAISNAVSNLQRIESQTLPGLALIKIFFQPGTNIDGAIAQVTAVSQTILRRMPPGTQPPLIVRYNASSVPILQLSLSSETRTESQVTDFAQYGVRNQVVTVPGTVLPLPFGGKPRQIMIDLDPDALVAHGLSAQDVNAAITLQNLTLPSGTLKVGENDFTVTLNSSPAAIAAIADVPVKRVDGRTIFVRDVASVRDGFGVQNNIVRRDGQRGALQTILKNGDASTLTVVESLKELLPTLRASAPPGVEIATLFDQSIFVDAAISNVLHEALIAGALTALMILLFLGSWRSTVVVATSIPLSILVSVLALDALGLTLNVMTLGGLALAVGILVDDATVEVENIHRNLALGKPLRRAILDGAQQIAVPAFVATTAICIVFVSVVFLEGPPRYLFVPFALAVVFAVFASYLLSRTLVPVMVEHLLSAELAREGRQGRLAAAFSRVHAGFERSFERFADGYLAVLAWSLRRRAAVLGVMAATLLLGAALVPFVGRDFFPSVDAGQIRLHVRGPSSLRIEESERMFQHVEDEIRAEIPAAEIDQILDNFGRFEGINMAFRDTANLGPFDGEVLVSLREGHAGATDAYVKALRERLPAALPGVTFYFQPADIVTQILNFGLPAPIDVQVTGPDRNACHDAATRLARSLAEVPGLVDVHVHQVVDAPELHLDVDRARALERGLGQRDVANNVLVTLSGTAQVQPAYWVDPASSRNYLITTQTPQVAMSTVEDLATMPISTAGAAPVLLGDLSTLVRRTTPVNITHANVQPCFDVYAAVQGVDLGSVEAPLRKAVAGELGSLPAGSKIELRGQINSMSLAFTRLLLGIVFAGLLVYFLMVVNFQSWLDPFIIVTALPGALAGIALALFATRTTFNVPSLMGTIMCIGVATSNSILLITFANQRRLAGDDALSAALAAGHTRLRPVVMTALAMILGMLPMSLGLGEGGEQNAPLGRAVIGGLLLATATTLVFVPVVYTLLRRKAPRHLGPDLDDEPATRSLGA
ncbi:MAG TPA: efflux RND transporter permease subunit [Planctomycetota bacterium]|nr:efflux RND transporter permease subunit [Planctomycetota bacterium]